MAEKTYEEPDVVGWTITEVETGSDGVMTFTHERPHSAFKEFNVRAASRLWWVDTHHDDYIDVQHGVPKNKLGRSWRANR